MPIPNNTLRASFRGTIRDQANSATVVEEFAMHLNFQLESELGVLNWDDTLADAAGEIASRFITNWTQPVGGNASTIETRFPPTVVFEQVRLYRLNAAGLTQNLQAVSLGALEGTGDVSLPPQCATAVSLYAYAPGTFNAAGRRGRGRFYLPPVSRAQVDHPGRLSLAAQTAIANWTGALLNDLHRAQLENPVTALLLILAGSDGVARRVERCRVGKVVDTQRRRRGELAEEYQDRVVEDV